MLRFFIFNFDNEQTQKKIILLQLKMLISSQNTIIPTLFNFLTNINKRKNVGFQELKKINSFFS